MFSICLKLFSICLKLFIICLIIKNVKIMGNGGSVVSGAIMGGSSLLGSVINAIAYRNAQKSANRTNLEITDLTNQANQDLYERQFRDFVNYNNALNEYNSPLNQVIRLRQAGLNPALSFGGVNTASAVQTPSEIPAVGGHVESVGGLDLGLSDAAALFANAIGDVSLKKEQAKGLAIDNMTRMEQNRLALQQTKESLLNQRAERGLTKSQKAQIDAQIKVIEDTLSVLSDTREQRVQNWDLQNKYLDTQSNYLLDESVRRNAELAIKEFEARSHVSLNQAQINQVNALARSINDTNLRDWNNFEIDNWLKRIDAQLKSVQLERDKKDLMFQTIMNNSEILHTELKDASEINLIMERAFGLGLRDVGTAIRNLLSK